MNVTRKQPRKRLSLSNEFPELPKLKAPWDRSDTEKYQAGMEKWWADVREAIQRRDEAITAEIAAMNEQLAKVSEDT